MMGLNIKYKFHDIIILKHTICWIPSSTGSPIREYKIHNPVVFRTSVLVAPCHAGLNQSKVGCSLVVLLVKVDVLSPKLGQNTKCGFWQVGMALPQPRVYYFLCLLSPFRTLNFIRKGMKVTFQNMTRVIWLPGTFELLNKTLSISCTTLTTAFGQGVK